MTTPIFPAVVPNAAATRPTLSANGPGDSRLTTVAAVINARNALTRSTTIMLMTMAIPRARMIRGIAGWICPGVAAARTTSASVPIKFLSSRDLSELCFYQDL